MTYSTELDKKLYELFSPDYFVDRMGVVRKSKEPQLHDVFRIAKEKGLVLNITKREWEELYSIHVYGRKGMHNGFITFINPTLPLLQQSDETKSMLISLFS